MASQRATNNFIEDREFKPPRDRKDRRIKQQAIRTIINKTSGFSIKDLEEDLEALSDSLED